LRDRASGQADRVSVYLITGTSSGIGRETALRLVAAGHSVLAGVRDPADGESLRAEAGGDGELRPVLIDVTDSDSITGAAAEIERGDGRLDGLVNNAGEPVPGPLEVLPLEDFRHELETNVTGQLAVTQALLPALRRSEGRIVFVSSVGGRAAFPFGGAYHASKFALEALGEALRKELADAHVAVSLVEPGVTRSEIWAKAEGRLRELIESLPPELAAYYRDDLEQFGEGLRKGDDGMEPGKVAATIEKALTESRPSARYPVGAAAKVLSSVRPLVPDRVYDTVARRPFTD
jgi:NAD(P)-dependent dehydrogenase (short-subunit alcohol dehydrogenase family)